MVGKRRKKALHKDFWQEIRKSRARFISIFCIVALGVAFFSGIQASSPDMRLSGDDYYNEETEDKGITEVIIGKHRNGPTGTVKLRFFHELTKFADYTNKVE